MNVIKQSPIRKPGRPLGDHEQKRRDILDAAISVIARNGYRDTSLRRVAARAGQTTGAVTYYFVNKSDLTVAIAEHLYDTFDSMLTDANSVEEALTSWLRTMTAESDVSQALVEMVSNTKQDPTLARIFQLRNQRYQHNLSLIIKAQQQRGSIRTDLQPDILADMISGMADGWTISRPIDPKRFTPRKIAKLVRSVSALLAP